MTLNLAQKSFKVSILVLIEARTYVFLLVVNRNLDPILHRFRDTAAFAQPTPISAKIWMCSLWSRSVTFWCAESEMVRLITLISREIIFAISNLYDPRYLNVTDRQTDRQTMRTDNLPWQYRAPLGFAR